jgi:hypothetical protein
MTVIGMANLAVKVGDLDAACAFYESAGADVRNRMEWNGAERADVYLGPVMITLFTRAIYEDSVDLPAEGFLHPALFTDDLDTELEGHDVVWGRRSSKVRSAAGALRSSMRRGASGSSSWSSSTPRRSRPLSGGNETRAENAQLGERVAAVGVGVLLSHARGAALGRHPKAPTHVEARAERVDHDVDDLAVFVGRAEPAPELREDRVGSDRVDVARWE